MRVRNRPAAQSSQGASAADTIDPGVAAIRRWYAEARGTLPTIAQGDLIASGWYALTPILWLTDGPPPLAEAAVATGESYEDSDGNWNVRPPMAKPEPDLRGIVVLTVDGAGLSVVTSRDVTHDRENALRTLPIGDDAALMSLRQLVTGQMPSGRRDGASPRTGVSWRRGHSNVAIARALVAKHLMGLGWAHRAAIREWVRWEHELGGQYDDHDVYAPLAAGHTKITRVLVDQMAATNRRVWRELDANLYPRAAPETGDSSGHEPGPSDPSQ